MYRTRMAVVREPSEWMVHVRQPKIYIISDIDFNMDFGCVTRNL